LPGIPGNDGDDASLDTSSDYTMTGYWQFTKDLAVDAPIRVNNILPRISNDGVTIDQVKILDDHITEVALIKVDEMEANTAPLVKFNTGAYNLTELLTVTRGTPPIGEWAEWNAEAIPVVKLPTPSGSLLNVGPAAPTVEGMYMTIIYPVGPVYGMGNGFDLDTVETPAPADTEVHRVYYSSKVGSFYKWKDA